MTRLTLAAENKRLRSEVRRLRRVARRVARELGMSMFVVDRVLAASLEAALARRKGSK